MEASNAKAMRDALLMVKKLFDGRIMFQPAIREAHKVVNAALAAPPRNCDVGTAEEQAERYMNFCRNHPKCTGCPCVGRVKYNRCEFAWAQMPYEEAKG